jgi:hypothetical protein
VIAKNYIILAHKNPQQLERLINSLEDGCSFFYIHVDLKSDINEFIYLQKGNVKFIEKRVDCIWGDFSTVITELNCIEAILADERKAYTILISGQDYPIKSKGFINAYLEQNAQYEHIDLTFMPPSSKEFYVKRLLNIKINLSSRRYHFVLLPYFWSFSFRQKVSFIKYLVSIRLFKKDALKMFQKRKMPFESFYYGAQWWGFSHKTLLKLYNYTELNKSMLFNFFKHVLLCDEIFFHTVLYTLQKSDASIKIKPSLLFADWNPRENSIPPATFDSSDLQQLLHQPEHKLFARKFDMDLNNEILDLLDKNLNEEQYQTQKSDSL